MLSCTWIIEKCKFASDNKVAMISTEGKVFETGGMSHTDLPELRERIGTTNAWVMSNCKFAQDREQLHFDFYNPDEYKPIPKKSEGPDWPDPTHNPLMALTEIVDFQTEDTKEFLKTYDRIYATDEVSFDDASASPKADPVIVVSIGENKYVIDGDRVTEANEWLNNIGDHVLGYYVPYLDFNKEFWLDNPGIVYHGTSNENVESIMRDGLMPSNKTRAITNRHVGSAIFTSPDPDTAAYHYDAVIGINTGAMAADGFTPTAKQEEPFDDVNMKNMLAYKIGVENFDASTEYESSEGLSTGTVVFFEPIPPKYLTLISGGQENEPDDDV